MSFAPSQIEHKISIFLHHCTFEQLKQVHAFLIFSSLAQHNALSSLCIRRAAELGETDHAELIFSSGDHNPHILQWNALIRGCFQCGHYKKALNLFDEMIQTGLTPNEFSFSDAIASCVALEEYGVGKKAHCRAVKTGFDLASLVSTSLFNFYSASNIVDARKTFDGFSIKAVGLWNKMMSLYVGTGDVLSARKLFDEMPVRDVVSWNAILSGYVRMKQVEMAKELFEEMPERNVFSYTLMVGALAEARDLTAATKLFDEMPEKNIVAWNCMLSAYTQSGRFKQALDLFLQMQSIGILPDGFTFVSALSACAHLRDLKTGRWIHLHLIGNWMCFGAIVGTSLMEMYAKCGDIDSAFRIFIKTANKDVFCWNVMIKALAVRGRASEALQLFGPMRIEKLQLNSFTFMSVLFACSHGGLVEEGCQIFESMEREFKIKPRIEHYGCLVDLLCRAGRLEEAYEVVKEMPLKPDGYLWGALFGGLRAGNYTDLAGKVMEIIQEVDDNGNGVFPTMSAA